MAAYTTIDDPEAYFQVKIYTGDGATTQAITLDGDTDMQPDLVWIKSIGAGQSHILVDAVRGANKYLGANHTGAEGTDIDSVTAFGSDGFTVGDDASVNQSSTALVAWCWKESATAGFDIVAYTGNGTDDTDISHSLSAVPKMIIVKNRDAADAWQVYHGANTSAPETDYLVLDTNAGTADAADRWSDEAPTSSVFTLGDGAEVNTNTEDYIAYCFADVQGFSKFGGYTGTASSGSVFNYTGFFPSFLLIKKTSEAAPWQLFDLARDGNRNPLNQIIFPDTSAANSDDPYNYIDALSNGFRLYTGPSGQGTETNKSGHTFIYMAFAEAPFVNSNGVPCNAR